MIRSGSVFVFDEAESGIRRWTDGRLWSPSRIHGNFLVYRELERRSVVSANESSNSSDDWLPELESMEGVVGVDPRLIGDNQSNGGGGGSSALDKVATSEELGLSETLLEKKNRTLQRDHNTANSKVNSRYVFKRDGLVKRTMSAKVDGHWQHLVCYYSRADFASVVAGAPASDILFAPTLMAELRAVRVPIDLVVQQNFRRPPLLTTSSGGPSRREVPLTAAPRPRRHSHGDINSVSTAATPIPIATFDDNILPDEQLLSTCVNRIIPNSVISLTTSPSLLDLVKPGGGFEEEEEEGENDNDNDDGDDADGEGRPRWTSIRDNNSVVEQMISMDSEAEEWGSCFLRGGDPSLAPAYQHGD